MNIGAIARRPPADARIEFEPMLTGSQIRRKFLDFFVQKGHREVHSSSLVPANDPTLLFTNAGMNQFKDVFLGLEKRDYNRATSSQKCVRAGGKHNDLENVGFTNRHHTFFEMLGNFSFGDYFKKDAIGYAWELITSPEWFGIEKDKLYVTIFEGADVPHADIPRDDEAEQFWLASGVPRDRIFAAGMEDNFWQMGDTGPCGPCSEIHYDMGPKASDQGHVDCKFPCGCGRYVEIWNLVFMQYDRETGVTNGVPWSAFKLLPKPSIDTGMGLERVTAVLQGVISNYETDLFVPLIKRAAKLTGTSLTKELEKEAHAKSAASLRVIADHSRAATFLISDGVLPANEGRGYVLRKIIRRAITHGRLLGQTKPFLHEMIFAVRDLMQDAYPELNETENRISKAVLAEETRFGNTLTAGLARLEDAIMVVAMNAPGVTPPASGIWTLDTVRKLAMQAIPLELPGIEAFKVYDTYGVPKDFIEDFCRDLGVGLDNRGFDRAMAEQRERARASWKGAAKQTADPAYQKLPKSEFEGYRQTRSENCEVLAIIRKGQGVQELKAGEEGEVILDHTPFYAESGGQVGDRGWLYSDDHNIVLAEVKGCYYPVQGVRAHQVIVKSPPSAKNAEGWGTLRTGGPENRGGWAL